MTKTKTAKFVKRLEGFQGDARLYHLSEPVGYDFDFETDAFRHETEYVVSSAAVTYDGPETYLFPADSKGKVLDWGELPGSFRGSLDHEKALDKAGFSLAVEKAAEKPSGGRLLRLN